MKKTGFTLIELLTVMAVVSIMSAIAMAQFSLYQRKATDALAYQELINVRTSISAFLVDVPQIAVNAYLIGAITIT